MGNQITHEIPDLSDLVFLEDLNLSSNNIISYFLNINMATNNYTEHSHAGNTHVSHFNLMLTGRELGNNTERKKNLVDANGTQNSNNFVNLSNTNYNANASSNMERIFENNTNENQNSDIIGNNLNINKNANNDLENMDKAESNLNSTSQMNIKNNNIGSLNKTNNPTNVHSETMKIINNLTFKSNTNNNSVENDKASNNKVKENTRNNKENSDDRISNHSKLINDLKENTENSFNNYNNNTNKNYVTEDNYKKSENSINKKVNEQNDSQLSINNQEEVDTYEEWQKFLRTNLQDFYHKLSALKNLKTLNLSYNKIHFFDIDPYFIQQINGFSKLNKLDVSFNLIEEEISILLVMNIPNLKSIDITCNPITRKKTAYENIEYEIFKTKNILLINSKPYNFNFQVWNPPNKINYTKRKNHNKYANLENPEEDHKKKLYKVNHEIKLDPVRHFNNKMKSKIKKMIEQRKKIDEEIIKNNEIPEYEIDILENSPENVTNIDNEVSKTIEEKNSLRSYLNNSKKNKENVFLTNTNSHLNKILLMKDKNYEGNEGSENYINFLNLANKCFGKEKHYKNIMPISNAYQKLRFILNNLPTNANENYDHSNNYMKSTISRSIQLDEYKPDNKNFKKEFKLLKQMNKRQIINESENEDVLNSSVNLIHSK